MTQKHAKRCKRCTCGVPDERLGGLFELRTKSTPLLVIKEKEEKKVTKVSYSAVVLTGESRNKLLSMFKDRVPEGWEIVAHHMTVNLGELPADLKPSIGLPVEIKVVGYFTNDKVAALMVLPPQEMQSFVKNKHPHITLAVNRAAGGKPVMSNQMIEDELRSDEEKEIVGRLFTPVSLIGQLQEVPFK